MRGYEVEKGRYVTFTDEELKNLVIGLTPRAKVEGPLRAIGYGEIELRDTDGNVVKPKKAPGPH